MKRTFELKSPGRGRWNGLICSTTGISGSNIASRRYACQPFQMCFRYTLIGYTRHYAIANTPCVCLCIIGEITLQEGDSIFSQSQSLAAAVQQPRAPRSQPWKIWGITVTMFLLHFCFFKFDREAEEYNLKMYRSRMRSAVHKDKYTGTVRYTWIQEQLPPSI